MFQSHKLEPLTVHDEPLEFEWDAERGELRGRDADRVRAMAAEAASLGEITGHPYPTAHVTRDPLRSLAEMAVVLGNYWRLSDGLAAAYPAQNEAAEEDLADTVY